MKESLKKYLAGLIDADGSISFRYQPLSDGSYHLGLRVTLCAAESVDRHGFVKSLPTLTGVGSVTHNERKEEDWSPINTFDVCSRSDLEKFIPHVAKHMVIKGRHFNWCLETFRALKGVKLTEEEVERLKREHKESRENPGPIKHKKHPTYAWVCGYLEGDGYFSLRTQVQGKKTCVSACVGAVSHLNDRIGIDLLVKAFGGVAKVTTCGRYVRWRRNLGPKDAKFALPFLAKLIQYSHIKKHKMETIIHNTQQRLSKTTLEGEAIV